MKMAKYALWVMLEAKAGKEADVAAFLKSALPLVEAEPATVAWYALDLGGGRFGIYDTFDDEAGRDAHLGGEVAKALFAHADELLAKAPSVSKIEILAEK
jgi:quinol monooxygenase YgiN